VLKTEILISCDDWENRVAVLEEGSLAEIYFEREEKVIGSIYKGRVENVLPGMGACFVNIGLGRNAFLYVDDIMRDPINIGETEITDRRRGHTVNELLKVGSEVLVQIVKEPRGLKGARVSTNVSLPGRYLVLMPTGRYSGVSSRIEDAHERERLKQIMRRVRPEGMATIVRTAAQGVSEAELIADLGVQLRLWHGILESYKRSTAPALLHKDLNLVFKAVRDFLTSDVSAVYIDSKEQYDEIRSTMSLLGPQYIDRLKLVDGPGTLFEQRGVDEELQKLLKPKIPLPSGGHLVLEHTEALTVIDVNTGKFTGGRNLEDTIVRTNVEAAAEIARQVRLRDIGGIIVVDFIDMSHERNRQQVIATLTEALRRDRTRSTIQDFSNLGLLEFTRKRVGKDLAGQLRSDCPYCLGLGNVMSSETVAIGVLRQIRERVSKNGVRKLDVVADPGVATQLLGWYKDEFEKLARDHDIDVALYVEPGHHREQVVVEESRRLRAAPLTGNVVEAELLGVRLPNPASGVAEVNGYLIEVKDAANAIGQTVKLRIGAVEGNLVRADLAEPLPTSGRRRRPGRGRGKDVAAGDKPIAPPVPALREIAAPDESRRLGEEAERRPERPGRREAVAFSVADDDEEAPRVATPAARAAQPAARSTRGRPQTGRGDSSARGGRRRPGGRGTPPQSQPLVVGGEGDIDYDDGDEDAVITSPSTPVTRHARPAESDAGSVDGSPQRRRRRRGRGGKGRAEEPRVARPASIEDEGEPVYGEEDAPPPRHAPPTDARDRVPREPRPHAYDEDEAVDDDLSAVVDPRQPSGGQRPQKRFGPVRQLYGRPVSLDEERVRPQRPPREDPRAKRGQEAPPQGRPPRAAQSRQGRDQDDELDVVIKPRGPAVMHVEMRSDVPVRRRPSHDDERAREEVQPRERERQPRDRGERQPRERDERQPQDREVRQPRETRDRGPRDRDRGERGDRDRAPRGDRREGRDRGPRFGGGRGREAAPKREGPTVRQVYPPPGQEPAPQDAVTVEESASDTDQSPKPAFGRRQPRGPLMRPSNAPPIPKGKVRQLYPPPDVDEAQAPQADVQVYNPLAFDEAGDVESTSVFVNDAEELDDRRRRARERAEARRRAEAAADSDAGSEASPGGTATKPYDAGVNESDEWPVF
ncbi:MAG TPA: Rne/Rng family ribonuclease, partial [Candidatus Acidoferrales bacterium]|nr:Rne/Rng family ribonuclease [Candidatus Acidoferrales bacterium]